MQEKNAISAQHEQLKKNRIEQAEARYYTPIWIYQINMKR